MREVHVVGRQLGWIGPVALMAGVAGADLGCNMITGADGVRLVDDDDGDSSASAGGGAVAATGAGGGATVSATSAGVGGTSTSATQVASSTTASGAGGSTQPCQYPAGPYGVAQGQVVPPNLSWQGYPPGASQPTTISIQDFFDCDGSKGIDAVMVDTSQFG